MTNPLADSMSEAELRGAVIQLLQLKGFLVHCVLDTRVPAKRAGDMGFPDIVAVSDPPRRRDHRLLFIELKAKGRGLSPQQRLWHMALYLAKGKAEYYLFRPASWLNGTIERVLE